MLLFFDFLLEESIAGRRPKATEIAEEIFGEGAAGSGNHGSRVRVGIHRLRKKLDLYYEDKPGPRLVIPTGEYGFVIELPGGSDDDKAPVKIAPRRVRYTKATGIAVCALLLANIVVACFYFKDAMGLAEPNVRSLLWQPFDETRSPTVIAIGDYFMFASRQTPTGVEEVIQDMAIDSPDAFYEYVANTPGARDSVKNEDLYAVSSDILGPISELWAYLKDDRPVAVASSAVKPELIESSNIVYIGALDALTPLLGNPLFQASHFKCGATCYELIDKPSRRRFVSDSPYMLGDRRVPRRDYGYIASYPGPSGNQVVIISGTGDAGVTEMVDVVTNENRLAELGKHIEGNFKSFEALYHVRTMFAQTYGSSLVIARPLSTGQIWDHSQRNR